MVSIISFSQLLTYTECPYKYHLIYHRGLEEDKPLMRRGKAFMELLSLGDTSIELEPEILDQLELLALHLKKYLSNGQFEIKRSKELDNIILEGIADYISNNTLIEFKLTTSTIYNSITAYLQLSFYSILFDEIDNFILVAIRYKPYDNYLDFKTDLENKPDKFFQFYNRKEQFPFGIKMSRTSLEPYYPLIFKYINRLTSETEYLPRFSHSCNQCAFNTICLTDILQGG